MQGRGNHLCVWLPLIIWVSLDPGDLALLLVLQHVEGEGVVPDHQVPGHRGHRHPGPDLNWGQRLRQGAGYLQVL